MARLLHEAVVNVAGSSISLSCQCKKKNVVIPGTLLTSYVFSLSLECTLVHFQTEAKKCIEGCVTEFRLRSGRHYVACWNR